VSLDDALKELFKEYLLEHLKIRIKKQSDYDGGKNIVVFLILEGQEISEDSIHLSVS